MKCIQDEIPFEVPEGWEWSRLTAICSLISDIDHKMPKAVDDGVLFLSAKDLLNDGTINYSNDVKRISEEDFLRLSRKALPQKNDIIYSRIGACLGKARVVTKEIRFLVSYSCCTIRPLIIDSIFLASILDGNFVLDQAKKGTQSVGVPDLGMASIKQFLIPIPPFVEQQRIDERLQLALHIVQQISTEYDNLNLAVTQTKAKILDLAIRGKLVPQDPNDEPASVLLERIRVEKEELIKQGKIKRDKKESVIFKGDDNSYYQDLPKNWETCSIMAIAEVDLGKTLDKNKNKGKFYPYLRSINIKWNALDLSDIKEMRFEADELDRYRIVKNDLLICEGGDAGRCCIWDSHKSIFYQNALHRVRFYGDCEPKYFLYFMMHLEQIGYLKRISNGVTIKHLTKNALSTIPFMLPPLAEQKRIVEIIEKIFTKLDEIAN